MWTIKPFEELTTKELFDIYYLRTAVFVVEQECYYQEVDEADLKSFHVCLTKDSELVAYCRLIPDQESIHLGRVVVPKAHRKDGYGRDLVQTALDYCKEHFPNLPVHAQAQSYLQNFYASFGFEPISDVYLEDGIPHLDMIKK
ncbi:GNAT family N-acetyltransferase [Streptococcus hyointestinalis]|uniref:GNAT family N-acetyltransferase n=1 Tax=Streptococcus hyointestinalis TaxID=1337 RepID=UPI0013DF19EF|nr:GNAT family N-acetyltransferase [Streptococcus hyointestinalis]